jgi:hypothetical protein
MNLRELARDGALATLKRLPDATFQSRQALAEAATAAAENGRVGVLRMLERKGVALDRRALVAVAIRSDEPGVLRWAAEGGPRPIGWEDLRSALVSDAAGVLAYWFSSGLLEPRLDHVKTAVDCGAEGCLRVLARYEWLRPEVRSEVAAKGSSRLRSLFPNVAVTEDAAAQTSLAASVGAERPRRYSYLTPSDEIDVNATTLRFLIFRRIMRWLLLRRR